MVRLMTGDPCAAHTRHVPIERCGCNHRAWTVFAGPSGQVIPSTRSATQERITMDASGGNDDGLAMRAAGQASPAVPLPLAPLVAQVLHDLRGPLNTIAGWAGILERPAASPDLGARAADAILRATRMQARLLDEIGELGALVDATALPRESVQLAGLLDAVAGALEDVAAPHNVRIAVAVPRPVRVLVCLPAARAFFWWLGHAATKVAPAAGTLEFAAAGLVDGGVEVTMRVGPLAPRRRPGPEDPLAGLAIRLAASAGVKLTLVPDEGNVLARVGMDVSRD